MIIIQLIESALPWELFFSFKCTKHLLSLPSRSVQFYTYFTAKKCKRQTVHVLKAGEAGRGEAEPDWSPDVLEAEPVLPPVNGVLVTVVTSRESCAFQARGTQDRLKGGMSGSGLGTGLHPEK